MATTAPTDRRSEILRAAVTLFRQHGYHGTGIAELGEAVGITGPAVYRHFDSKADILVEAIIQGASQLAQAAELVRPTEDPVVQTRALIDAYLDVVVGDPDLIAVFLLESRHLPSDNRKRLTRRGRRYIEAFVPSVRSIHPDLDEREAEVLVQGVLGMPIPFCLAPSTITEDRIRLLADRMLVALVGH